MKPTISRLEKGGHSGAKGVLRSLAVGDYLLLLETVGPGGTFAYGGRVIAKPSEECFDLSRHLWGKQRFPLVVFLKGGLTSYRWYDFCDRLGYSRNWNPAGNTYRVKIDKITQSVYGDEETLIRQVVGYEISMEPGGVVADFPFVDPVEVVIETEEGRQRLREHLLRERSTALIQKFKRSLKDLSCAVCGFDFEKAYGDLGRGFIEAHHVKPVAEMEPGERTRLTDLVPVCSNCHRMLHRKLPALATDELRELMALAHIKCHGG